jgi:DNA-binding transcriptional LysR family regulator
MKFDDLTSLRVFKEVYELKSLTLAAKKMNLSKPAVSKRLEILESNLGQKLFSRTTRSMTPTSQAHKLIESVRDIILKVDALDSDAVNESQKAKRKIRITCIASMSQRFLGKLLREYQKKNPEVQIELVVTDSTLDLVEHNIDLAIRVNPSKNSHLVGRKISDYKLVMVASPKYLKQHPKIKSLKDLTKHNLLVLDQHSKILPNELLDQISFVTNDSPLMSNLILEGEGVGVRSSWDVLGLVKEGKLNYVMGKDKFKSLGDIWLLSSKERLESEYVRRIYEYLLE